MSDLVSRLRAVCANPLLLEAMLLELADEIARLRAELSGARQQGETGQPVLTDAEREAVEYAATLADAQCKEAQRWVGVPRWANGNVADDSWQRAADTHAAKAATLRGLLERMGGGE